MHHPQLQLATIISNPFEENTFVAWLKDSKECLIFDPGLEPAKILQEVERNQLTPAAILITHGHSDHIGGNHAMKARWPDCPLVIGHGDAAKLTDPMLNLSAQYGLAITSPPADVTLAEGETYSAAGFDFEIIELPGHSPGHIAYVWKAASPYVVFAGDVLFAGSIGRTDFPDGDFQALVAGIHAKLFTLPDDTIVLSGHGPPTTIGQEKRANPFVGIPSGYSP